MTQRQFRIFLIVDCVVFVIAGASAWASPRYFPPELRAYFDAQGGAELSWWDALALIWVIAYLILFVGTTVGLWRFWRWARAVRLWSDLIGVVLLPSGGPVIMTGLAYTVATLGSMIEGGLLALVYLSPVAAWFTATTRPAREA